MTNTETETLRALRDWHDAHAANIAARPVDIGGTNASHHLSTLNKLCDFGYVKRHSTLAKRRGTYRYAITDKGRAQL